MSVFVTFVSSRRLGDLDARATRVRCRETRYLLLIVRSNRCVADRWQDGAMLQPGTTAPPFALAGDDGAVVRLDDLAGRWKLLWWYPKASTGG
jgi:hypothetical protein